MGVDKSTNSISRFCGSIKYPVVVAIAAGLYPILFYYSNNFTLINSWEHLGYFVLIFLLVPIIAFVIAAAISALPAFSKLEKYVLPFLNVFVFLFLLKVSLYAGLQKKMILGIIIIAGIFAFFLHKHLKKLILIQFLLAIIGVITLVPIILKQLNYSEEWMKQPDDIEQAVFAKKPNVYFIQPDGYVNASEISKGYYQIDNSAYQDFISELGFKSYPDFRSNYVSTLTSNTATFMMKHHHYNKGSTFSEAINARDVIITDNAVLNIFKNNGYKTYFLAEMPYLLLNRPVLGYDESNFKLDDVSFISTGLGERQDILTPLKSYIDGNVGQPKFFFIEIFYPGHIHGRKSESLGVAGERELWIETLQKANVQLMQIIAIIKEKDPNALIITMADHGGFVGMEYTEQAYNKTEDRDLIYSIFSSTLEIHWPDGDPPAFDTKFKSAVNVFRILFSYLSEDEKYLLNLQADESFNIVKHGAPKGVYKYIDADGNITFKKF